MFAYLHETSSENKTFAAFKDTIKILFSIINLLIISAIVLPSSLIVGITLISYKFDFYAMSHDFYEYQSELSQVATKPGYVNYLSCTDTLTASKTISEMPPKPICENQTIESIPIEDAAQSAGKALSMSYLLIAILSTVGYLMFTSTEFAFVRYVRRYFINLKLKKIAQKHRINFCGNYRALSIGGLLVSEFGYLLRHYSNGKLKSFDNFFSVYEIKDNLLRNIDSDFESDSPREFESGMVGKETALGNLRNLKGIILAISEYTETCIANDIPVPKGVY